MEKRKFNRRDDDNRGGNRNNRRPERNNYENKDRRGGRPAHDSRHNRQNDDYDREESRRRRAIHDENWFDLEPDQSKNFESRNDRRERRQEHNDRNSDRPFKSRGSNRNDRRNGDRHEREYREYRRSHSYNDYDDSYSDDDDDEEFTYTPRNRRDRSFDRDSRLQHRPKSDGRASKKENDSSVRLNKYIANAGICSRREADVLIASGAVTVNGEVVDQLGYKVKPGDVVHYGGEKLVSERKRYILLNKPKGFITTMDDPQERKTVMTLVADACTERIYPVGRLDRNTTGLLLFTNDGELAKKLTHPSTGARKVYHVELDKPLAPADRRKILEGISLEDGDIAFDAVEYNSDDRNSVGVELHSGRNRIVRRVFESLGYEVYKLDRVIFAELTKKNLPRGRWRELSPKEVGFLKML